MESPEKKRERGRKYYKEHKGEILKRTGEYQKKHRKRCNQYSKDWDKQNPERRKEINRKYRDNHKDKIEEYKLKNKERMKESSKDYRKKNKGRISKYNEEHRQQKKDWDKNYFQIPKVKKRKRDYLREKKKGDKNYKIACDLRSRFISVLKYYLKTGKISVSRKYNLNYEAIIKHLKPFPKNLKNYEIHHIKPLSIFNFINEDDTINFKEIKKAFTPKNHKFVTKEEHKEIHSKLKKIK